MRDLSERERRAIRAHKQANEVSVSSSSGRSTAALEEDMSAVQLYDDNDWDDEDEDVDPEVRKIWEESSKVRKICNNPKCLTVKMKKSAKADAEDVKMMYCSRCKVATYCSAECQRADWKRHKQEPCKPFEDLVLDNDLWNEFGQRTGTMMFETRV
ncbi:hypothetical protein NM688_g4930 [Phlebia brevispora]|uniref:Uncharacterized protein n=1 Tax=Phlebia brevispora TaxID=194682 RepID=A0ACC1T1J7_9APHY|nr:hypothetical protein NM688_g4930 [Phlebia brevispora]